MDTIFNWVMNMSADDYFRLKFIGSLVGVALVPVAFVVGAVIGFRDYKVKLKRREEMLSRLKR